MYLVLKIALWGKAVNTEVDPWGLHASFTNTQKRNLEVSSFAKPEKSYHVSHPGFYKNKKLYFKEQKASLVRIKNICVLLMTILRKTWRSIAHEEKNAIKY